MLNVVDLRNRGVKAIEEEINANGTAILSYRGKPKYVIIEVNEYERLRDLELMWAYLKAEEDIAKGSVEIVKTDEELENHLNELKNSIRD